MFAEGSSGRGGGGGGDGRRGGRGGGRGGRRGGGRGSAGRLHFVAAVGDEEENPEIFETIETS
jgi:hypothetical protein